MEALALQLILESATLHVVPTTPDAPTDLPRLFASRKDYAGSTRDMSARAAAAGFRLSHSQFGKYLRGEVDSLPSEQTRRAIAAALGVGFDEVTAAAWASVASAPPDTAVSQHAIAFLRLTAGRTDEEIRQTLGVVEATLRAMEASREAAAIPDNSDDGT